MAEQLVADREAHAEKLRSAGMTAYPTWHDRTHSTAAVQSEFERLAGRTVTVAGRVGPARVHGGIRFLDLADATGHLQLLARRDLLGAAAFSLLDAVDPGDVVAATGEPTRTEAGEPSIALRTWKMLAKAVLPFPEKRAGLKDEEARARRRELDLLANARTRQVFTIRATVFQAMRAFLAAEGFTEVETPILQSLAGGAAARPFRTHHDALDLDLSLRIAPELFLKRLVIGGYEKIFEIGRVFRNEGMDRQHNPEFTIGELYQAYATVEDLLPLTERLVAHVLQTVHGTLRIPYGGRTLDFTPPWPRARVVDALRRVTGIDLLTERDPTAYRRALQDLGAPPPPDQSLPNLMDELVREAIRKKTDGPLHLLDAPVELVPLAKRREDEPKLAQRLQVLVAGMELINAYTEENDPAEQAERFREQARLRGDDTLYPLDHEYLEALKLGLPPTAGWGIGLDRLVMLAADAPSIREVLLFPLFRPRGKLLP